MPTRRLKMEPNTKYIPAIHQIVEKRTKEFLDLKEVDLATINFAKVQPAVNNILADLSYEIFVTENRYRYQQEQKLRHFSANKKFNTRFYSLASGSLDDFVKDYNSFLWNEIKSSHNFLSNKIEANYRRNYHDGETSPVTSLIFYLYFKTGKVQKFIGQVLAAAYRNPYSAKQQKII
jgi:hypothetical protein